MSTMKQSDEEAIDLLEARKELDEARKDYEAKKEAEDDARRQETAAKNRLNEAQKRFDMAVESIKAAAPRDTEWWQIRNRPTGRCNGVK